MRTVLLLVACLGFASACLTADATCDSISPGAPVPLAAKPADELSFCERAPAGRHLAGFDAGPSCRVAADGGCDSQLYSYGELFEEGSSGDSGQCCLVVSDGVVIRTFVGFTY